MLAIFPFSVSLAQLNLPITFDDTNVTYTMAGTAAFDPSYPYKMASVFFNFGTSGTAAGDKTYYWDDVQSGSNVSIENDITAQAYIFPNPATNVLNVKLPENMTAHNLTYHITDMAGKTVLSGNMNQSQIAVNSLASGLYLLQIQTEKGMIRHKFVK